MHELLMSTQKQLIKHVAQSGRDPLLHLVYGIFIVHINNICQTSDSAIRNITLKCNIGRIIMDVRNLVNKT